MQKKCRGLNPGYYSHPDKAEYYCASSPNIAVYRRHNPSSPNPRDRGVLWGSRKPGNLINTGTNADDSMRFFAGDRAFNGRIIFQRPLCVFARLIDLPWVYKTIYIIRAFKGQKILCLTIIPQGSYNPEPVCCAIPHPPASTRMKYIPIHELFRSVGFILSQAQAEWFVA